MHVCIVVNHCVLLHFDILLYVCVLMVVHVLRMFHWKEVQALLEEKENLMHEMQSQEKEFKLQNQTVMEELSLVCAIDCVAAMLQWHLLSRCVNW